MALIQVSSLTLGLKTRFWGIMEAFCQLNCKSFQYYANPKTYKDGWPLRHIISCCGTAIENVAKWVEVHLRHLAKIHPTYIEDTRHFFERIERINEKYALLPSTTFLISWNIENFYQENA